MELPSPFVRTGSPTRDHVAFGPPVTSVLSPQANRGTDTECSWMGRTLHSTQRTESSVGRRCAKARQFLDVMRGSHRHGSPTASFWRSQPLTAPGTRAEPLERDDPVVAQATVSKAPLLKSTACPLFVQVSVVVEPPIGVLLILT